MSEEKIRILLIEDNPGDARLVEEDLKHASQYGLGDVEFELRWFNLLSTGLYYLSSEEYDVVLLDLNLPDCQGLEGIERVLSIAPNIPVIILSGLNDETKISETLNRGAWDYIVKGESAGEKLFQILLNVTEKKRKK